jgi:membrane-bound inhibitor of C-type lysozyme
MDSLENLDNLEKQIIKELESFIGRVENWDFEVYWTKGIKETLYNIAKRNEYNYHVAASGIKSKDSGEWLYDLVWYNWGQGFLEDVYLVVESEWLKDLADIQLDFEKLIVARSKHRLMIFQADTEQILKSHIEELNTIVDKCKISTSGDRYLYAAYSYENKCFFFDLKIK